MNFIGNKLIPAALLAASASVAISAPAQAFTFGNSGISFDEDTTVNLRFIGGSGAFVSNGILDFGVGTPSGGDGAAGIVLDSLVDSGTPFVGQDVGFTATYTFLAGVEYTLFLTRQVNPAITVFSTDTLNAGDVNYATFVGNLFSPAGVTISWEDLLPGGDTYKRDNDFNDYVIGATAVPTPAAVLPVIAGLFGAASRKKQEEEA